MKLNEWAGMKCGLLWAGGQLFKLLGYRPEAHLRFSIPFHLIPLNFISASLLLVGFVALAYSLSASHNLSFCFINWIGSVWLGGLIGIAELSSAPNPPLRNIKRFSIFLMEQASKEPNQTKRIERKVLFARRKEDWRKVSWRSQAGQANNTPALPFGLNWWALFSLIPQFL